MELVQVEVIRPHLFQRTLELRLRACAGTLLRLARQEHILAVGGFEVRAQQQHRPRNPAYYQVFEEDRAKFRLVELDFSRCEDAFRRRKVRENICEQRGFGVGVACSRLPGGRRGFFQRVFNRLRIGL